MQPQRISYGPHTSEFADIYGTPGNPREQKLVVIYHGGFWKEKYGLEWMAPLAEDLAQAGCLVANVEYPRVGEKNTSCVSMRNSVSRSFEAVAEKYYDYRQRIVVGHSAGGYNALTLASTTMRNSRIMPTKVIAQAPITDLWTGQFIEQLSDEHDAIANFVNAGSNVPRDKAYYDAISPMHTTAAMTEFHLVHGMLDKDVPWTHSQLFQRNNPAATLHTVTLDGQDFDHYDVINVDHPIWALQKSLILS